MREIQPPPAFHPRPHRLLEGASRPPAVRYELSVDPEPPSHPSSLDGWTSWSFPSTRSPAAARWFKGARRDLVERHLETLTVIGELRKTPVGRYQPARP